MSANQNVGTQGSKGAEETEVFGYFSETGKSTFKGF